MTITYFLSLENNCIVDALSRSPVDPAIQMIIHEIKNITTSNVNEDRSEEIRK